MSRGSVFVLFVVYINVQKRQARPTPCAIEAFFSLPEERKDIKKRIGALFFCLVKIIIKKKFIFFTTTSITHCQLMFVQVYEGKGRLFFFLSSNSPLKIFLF